MKRPHEKSLARDERGMETVEWAIVAGLLAAGLVVIVVALGPLLARAYAGLRADLTGQPVVTTERGQ